MTPDELAVMDGGKYILQVRGLRPFFSDKLDITKLPKYKYLSDADPKNAFDMEKLILKCGFPTSCKQSYPQFQKTFGLSLKKFLYTLITF